MSSGDSSLDNILVQVGEFGKYQKYVFGLVCLAVILHSGVHIAYVFTAMDVNYRCLVPECDTGDTLEYKPQWLPEAVPYSNKLPAKCEKFYHENINLTNECSNFNTERRELCNSYVFENDENSIVQEYDLYCESNLWKLTMVGTINNVGQFFGLFLSGLVSDRYGRRVVVIWGMIFCSVFGIIKTFSPTYIWFLGFEFMDALFGAGTYACGFIIGIELVGPKKRMLTGTLISSCYAIGEIFTAGSAWIVRSWKPLIYIVYGPPLLLFVYTWIVPESVRWNLSKGHVESAKETLRKAAKFNGVELSENSLDKLNLAEFDEKDKPKQPLYKVFKSTTLLLRFINCCFCWITCAFLFYGLTLNSVALAGNKYLDFILTAIVEIPAYFACAYFVDKLGRRISLTGSFFITGITCCAFIFIPLNSEWGRLSVYLLGKFGATAAFTVCYVITSELFPTPLRNSVMGICSTFGRIGSMISPQTPLLTQIWTPLPLVMFSSMATVAGFLTLLFPETYNIKLPDTIEEAENIGKTIENEKPELK